MAHSKSILGAVALACAIAAPAARCQDYPAKPVVIVSEASLGSIGDVAIRLISKKMGEGLGQNFVVDGRPGAQGALAAAVVKRAEPDGYTLFCGASTGLVIARFMVKNVPYDALTDFDPVSAVISTATYLVARKSLGFDSLGDLVAYAKAHPGKLSYGTTGPGSPFHLWMEALQAAAGIRMLHVPYSGGKASVFVNDILADRLDVLWLSQTLLSSQLKNGKLSVLAANQEQRSKALPQVPTVGEVLPNYVFMPSLYALMGPKGLPPAIANRLAASVREAERNPEVAAKMEQLGMIPLAGMPEDLERRLKESIRNVGSIAAAIGLEPK
jgi:tripartite-type tricarboxylate transporter receptor subunit TctC